MKTLIVIAALVPSSVCVAAACAMAIHGIGGWGWFLFVGLLFAPSWSSK